MPLLGFGVYQNYNTKPSVVTAFAAGYRYVIASLRNAIFLSAPQRVTVPNSDLLVFVGMSTQPRRTRTKPKSEKLSERVVSNEATCSSVR